MAITFAPTPIRDVLLLAARTCGPAGDRLYATIANDFPDSLRRRTAQLMAEADATADDLDAFLAAAGFTDLEELRARAGKETNNRIAAADRYFTSREGEGGSRESLRRVLSREQQNLAQTLQALQAGGVLETAAAAVLAGRRRWILGDLKSVGYASLLATDLGASLRNVILISPTAASALTALTDAHHSDVLVAFSFQHYSRLTLEVARQLHLLGTTVIAVTDDAASPIAEHADHLLVVHTGTDASTHSPTAVAAVGHVLASLAAAGAKGAARRNTRRAEMSRALHCYPAPEELSGVTATA